MPNRGCTIILNGHGIYTHKKVINIQLLSSNYNIIFPCGLGESISNAHHNMILSCMAFPCTNLLRTLEIVEKFSLPRQ